MVYNQDIVTPRKSKNGKAIKVVDNFKYFGSWMKSLEKNFEIRKGFSMGSMSQTAEDLEI